MNGSLPIEGPPSLLISRRLLDECAETHCEVDWQFCLSSLESQSFRYPDASYEVFYDRLSNSQVQEFDRLYQALFRICTDRRLASGRDPGSEGFQTNYRGLWGTPVRLYTLWYPDSVQEGLGDQSLLVMPGPWSQVMKNESERDRLSISVALLRKPDEKRRRAMTSHIAAWFENVAHAEINSEGPVLPASEFVDWRGRAAFFEADFSSSNQFTLNWLTLWLVSKAHEIPIDFISYADPETELLKPMLKSPLIRCQLEVEALGPESVVDLSKTRHNKLRLQRGEGFKPDNAAFVISFSNPLERRQRKEVEAVIKSWLILGVHDAFEGQFSYESKMAWNSSFDEVRFTADLGRSRYDDALSVFERVIRSIDREIVGIESAMVE